jgi:hypothetical protein
VSKIKILFVLYLHVAGLDLPLPPEVLEAPEAPQEEEAEERDVAFVATGAVEDDGMAEPSSVE